MTFDVLIKNGMVVDGSGKKPAFKADIGISGDKIFGIGNLAKAKAKEEIDAGGMLISPGFIDVQNHSDSYGCLMHNPHLESLIQQGITTILMGQCGASLAPLMTGSLASIQKWMPIEGVNVGWTSMAEFFEIMSRKGSSVNLASMVGHTTLRRDFAGDAIRPLTPREESQINALLKRSLIEGAYGFSVGLAYSHERLSTEEEIIKLLQTTQNEEASVSFHLRDEGNEIFSSINEVFGLLRHVPLRSKISHLKILGEKNPAGAEKLLRMIEIAVRDGIQLNFDVYPFTASAVVLHLLLPPWAMEGGKFELLKKLQTKTARDEIIKAISTKNYPYEKITIATSSLGQGFVGKSIAQVARDQNTSPQAAILNLLDAAKDHVIVFWNDLEEAVMEEILKHPLAIISTDGSGYNNYERLPNQAPHPRSFGTTAEILGKYVREKKLLTMEEAVYKMSGLAAQWLGLKNRGVLAKNNYADVVVFDPEKIQNLSSYVNPFRYPAGINFVLVNGQIAVKNGEYQKKLAGRVLKK